MTQKHSVCFHLKGKDCRQEEASFPRIQERERATTSTPAWTSSSPPTRFVKSPQSGRFLTWSDFCNQIIICARLPHPNNPSYAPVSLRQPSLNPTVFSLVSVWKPAVSRWAEMRYKSRTSCWKLSVQSSLNIFSQED